MISTAVWSSRIQAALGREPRSVQEALEGLRAVLKGDEVAKREFFKAARENQRFERFSRDDRVALIVWAALKEALGKSAQPLGQKAPSSLVVRKDNSVKEEVKGVKPIGDWKSPEGRVYDVYPWDIPTRVRKGARIKHPQYGQGTVLEVNGNAVTVGFKVGRKKLALKAVKGMVVDRYGHQPDRRVADAKGWLERFLASGEEVLAASRLEREEELAGNPHFSEGIISQEVVSRLEEVGIRVDPYSLEDIQRALGLLPQKEAALRELLPELSQEFSLSEAQQLARQGLSSREEALKVGRLLKELAVLRGLRFEVQRAGFAPLRAVAYRDSSGEVVYTAPVYG
ncbi:hypothetical protein Mesil_0550 [Allomeiothermus silvanus DSM 9946]|uniref:Uncharacterized protein n=1 Tax=Allomeiothermus silvanus (strain ATCC 700542 / DSM 9946 / NBRC 106475 / NCIMB 13440 / VI-R2) TaxID=526227 RepID=D7BA45_ALLS1|nr:hypothetical protein [Allomeiothermus silvanus]ADH62479.1 hypothetical protein Mesil_0550 [Allomeiothermus silvanus DSM 9946]